MSKIKLPSKITKDSWFYKDNEELCKPHLGKYYISYSSVDSWENYRGDFIKQKFLGFPYSGNIYSEFGSFVGQAVENGEFPKENPNGFEGQENLDLEELRPEGAEYEKMILIDMESYVIVGFIDRFVENTDGCWINDIKTGGKDKENKYSGEDYVQVILYAYALHMMGKKIAKTDVYFIRRGGSHVKPPLKIGKEQFYIPLEYTEERVKFALNKVDRVVKEISDCYKTYLKIFKK